jgi:predicted RecB family nuclease
MISRFKKQPGVKMIRDTLASMIEEYQKSNNDGEVRDYIGASSIGSQCLRQIWYQFKGYKGENIPAKIKRTWEIGRQLEELVKKWLIDSGIKVYKSDLNTYSQKVQEFRGNLDGMIRIKDKIYILEIKTAKDASYNLFVRNGLQSWSIKYYAQMQSYMGMSGIYEGYIIVLNKDNSAISDEYVKFDENFYDNLEQKAYKIKIAEDAPPRISGNPLWYECKMCQYNKECHE